MANDAAWGEGWQQGRELSQERRAHKQMLSDEDRQQKASDLIGTRNGILSKLPTLLGPNGEKTPEYDAAFQQLTQAQQGLGQLYHPDKAPGALQKDWHFLLEKMHGIAASKGAKATSSPMQAPPTPMGNSSTSFTTPESPVYQKTMGSGSSSPANLPLVTPANGGMQNPNTPGFGPLTVTQSFSGKPVPGMVSQGNLDLSMRPNIDNGDGTHSSTFSMSFGTDKGEVLVPGVGDGKTYPARQLRVLYTLPDGSQKWAVPGNQPHNWIAPERPTPQNNEALDQYQKTGNNFGTFEDENAADAYGKTLHEDQEKHGHNGVTEHPVSQSGNVTIPAGPAKKNTQASAPSWGQAQILKQKAASMQKAQQEAELLASGAPLSPQQQAMSQLRTESAIREAQVDESLKIAEKLGITGPALDEFKQQLAGIKNVIPKPLTGAAGQPYKGNDGLYYQNVSNPDGSVGRRPMPPDWKPNSKAVRGTLINTKSNGWVQTWVDPYNPSRVVGFQKVTPGRQYTGTTSSSSSTDPFGVTTSTSRSTMPSNTVPQDVDLSGMQELPTNFNGEDVVGGSVPDSSSPSATAPIPSGSPNENTAPTATPPHSVTKPVTGNGVPHSQTNPTPAQLKSRIPARPPSAPGQFQVDSDGHIPDFDIQKRGLNRYLVQIANNLMDGTDISKVPFKDRGAAEELAKKYGWGGQGMFTPRETLQIKEGASFLNKMANSPALKVLDSGFFSNMPMIASSTDPTKEGFFGKVRTNLAAKAQSPQQREFMDLYRQLDAMAIGLRALVQSGRGTQKQTDLLISELPNPYNTPSSADARRRLQLVQNELDIAAKTGHLRGVEEIQNSFSPSSSHQHKEGDKVMLNGQQVTIKKIYPDGTFDY